MGRYKLKTYATGRVFDDAGWMLDDTQCASPSLIRAIYNTKQIYFKDNQLGLYKYSDWLPIERTLEGSCAPKTYKSEGIGQELGLDNLYITISGYWPEKGANMTTCSFKETEAFSVCGRLASNENRVLVVASAGNTARAFAKVCSKNKIKLLLCVPNDNLDALWFDEQIDNEFVKLITCENGGDYFDAINLSNIAVLDENYFAEGGAKNVARRDGMGTTMLSACEVIGKIPDFYFQAVGSGTGAIAAWETNLRLIDDGRWGSNKCKLIVSQNAPFEPMYDAWKAGSRALLEFEEGEARGKVEKILAKVLSNRKPPYSIAGGLYDALVDCGGEIVSVDNEKIRVACEMFEQLEGIDLHPAAGAAVASLCDAVNNGKVNKNDVVMINITGAGEKRFKQGLKEIFYLKPNKVFPIDANKNDVLDFLKTLF